ncbi:MAG: hypothetical protein NXI24_24315 [bacterium]|nr:hypothetical protein [bacterium]
MAYAYNIIRDPEPANFEAPESVCRCEGCGRIHTRSRVIAAGARLNQARACPRCWSARIDLNPLQLFGQRSLSAGRISPT